MLRGGGRCNLATHPRALFLSTSGRERRRKGAKERLDLPCRCRLFKHLTSSSLDPLVLRLLVRRPAVLAMVVNYVEEEQSRRASFARLDRQVGDVAVLLATPESRGRKKYRDIDAPKTARLTSSPGLLPASARPDANNELYVAVPQPVRLTAPTRRHATARWGYTEHRE